MIVADGIHSSTRSLALGDAGSADVATVDTKWGGWVVWAPDDAESDLGEEVWATPAIVLPLGAVWIALDRYLSSRTEQERSPGPGRLVIVGACVVAGVILFMSLMRLAVQ